MDDALQLVDALAGIIGLGVDVLGAKVAPLEAVDGTEVADLAMREAEVIEELTRPVAVPDLDPVFAERRRRRVALNEPQQLGDDGAGKDAFGSEEG